MTSQQHQSAYVSIRPHTSAYASVRHLSISRAWGASVTKSGWSSSANSCSIPCHTSAYVGIRQHTSAYVSIRQHTSAYVSIREHTSVHLAVARDIERLKYSDNVRLLQTQLEILHAFDKAACVDMRLFACRREKLSV